MGQLLEGVLSRMSCPILGLDPSEWAGVAFVGEIGGSPEDPQDIQLTYLDNFDSPSLGFAVMTIRRLWKKDTMLPSDWLVNFASRFEAGLVEERLRSGAEHVFESHEFEVFDKRPVILGRSVEAAALMHTTLPFSCVAFELENQEKCLFVTGAWRTDLQFLVSRLGILTPQLAASVDDGM